MAREALPAGFQVLLEPAFAFVVRHAYTSTFCEYCLGKINAAASASTFELTTASAVRFESKYVIFSDSPLALTSGAIS